MQKIKLKTEESGKKLLAAYAPPKWSETADDDDDAVIVSISKKHYNLYIFLISFLENFNLRPIFGMLEIEIVCSCNNRQICIRFLTSLAL